MMTTTATVTAVTTVTNWVKKFLYLNRVSKEIRIKIKSIYDKTTCFFSMHLIKKKINRQKVTTNEFRLQSVHNRSFVVQWMHKIYLIICTHNSSAFTQQSHSGRTVCSALKIIYIVFFDLIFFFYTYWERSFFFFFFFFSIDLKKITTHNISINLIKQWESSSSSRTDTVTTAKEEV